MSMHFAAGVDVIVRESGGYDERGNPLPETTRAIGPCAVSPGTTDDVVNRATGAIADYVVYAPAGTQIEPTARITLPDPWGGTWQVVGVPKPWVNPFSNWAPGVEINLSGRQG